MAIELTPRELLKRLIAFPSVSHNSNLDLIDFVDEYLASHGIAARRVYNDEGNKAALFAHIGPEIAGGVLLSGHTDVVPVDGQDWATDPFELVEKKGLLYGRGACDMKGFIALALWGIPQALKAGPKRPLQIALSYDEEIGCTGAPRMIDNMISTGMPKASVIIVGEPTSMKVVTGHKGSAGFKTHVRGHSVHSSLFGKGVSAVMESARLVNWANDQNELNQKNVSPLDKGFDPPFTTIHTGTIHGGTAGNITAKDCIYDMSFRYVPSQTHDYWKEVYFDQVERIQSRMKAVNSNTYIDVKQTMQIPPLRPEANGLAETLARRLTGDNSTNLVSYSTEAGQFQERGLSVVICGPGSVDQAHQPNEYVSVKQFNLGQSFLSKLIDTELQ